MSQAKKGKGMAGLNAGVSGNPTMLAEVSGCVGALCGMVDALEGSRKNQQIIVRMGAPDDLLVVSCAWSVRVGDVVAVAPVGSIVGDTGVTKPMLLDEAQLGWQGGSSNTAAVLNHYDLLPGDNAPSEKPEKRRAAKEIDKMGNETVEEGMESLYVTKPKLTKEEKAAARAEKAKQKAIANSTWVEPEEVELKLASKKNIKEAKSRAKKRREDGEDEVTTDIELESAGLFQ